MCCNLLLFVCVFVCLFVSKALCHQEKVGSINYVSVKVGNGLNTIVPGL